MPTPDPQRRSLHFTPCGGPQTRCRQPEYIRCVTVTLADLVVSDFHTDIPTGQTDAVSSSAGDPAGARTLIRFRARRLWRPVLSSTMTRTDSFAAPLLAGCTLSEQLRHSFSICVLSQYLIQSPPQALRQMMCSASRNFSAYSVLPVRVRPAVRHATRFVAQPGKSVEPPVMAAAAAVVSVDSVTVSRP